MARNLSLEVELRSLRNDYAEAIDDCAVGRDKLRKVEAEVQSKAHREEEAIFHLQAGLGLGLGWTKLLLHILKCVLRPSLFWETHR